MRATQISLWRSSFESEASEANAISGTLSSNPTRCRHSAGCISGFCDDSFISIAVPEPVPGAGSAKLRISSAAFALRFRESKGLLVGSGGDSVLGHRVLLRIGPEHFIHPGCSQIGETVRCSSASRQRLMVYRI